jgi:hypothetical protein
LKHTEKTMKGKLFSLYIIIETKKIIEFFYILFFYFSSQRRNSFQRFVTRLALILPSVRQNSVWRERWLKLMMSLFAHGQTTSLFFYVVVDVQSVITVQRNYFEYNFFKPIYFKPIYFKFNYFKYYYFKIISSNLTSLSLNYFKSN